MGSMRPRRFYLDDHEDDYELVSADPGKARISLTGIFTQGMVGSSKECSTSNFIWAYRDKLPFKVYGVQTARSTIDIIDRIKKNGTVHHARVFSHNVTDIVDANDKNLIPKEGIEKTIIMRPFVARKGERGASSQRPSTSEPHEKQCLRGAGGRAINWGLRSRAEQRRRDRVRAAYGGE